MRIVDADGANLRDVAGKALEGSFFSGNLTWSPDGSKLLFAGRTERHPGRALFVVPAAGGTPKLLPTPYMAGRPSQPTWSRSAGLIAFVGRDGIYVMRPNGAGLRFVAAGHGPVWSPDGRKFALRNGENQVVDVATGEVVSLRGTWGGLSWSPNSRFVAFAGGEAHGANGDVFVARADGTGLVRILHRPGTRLILPLWRRGSATTETG